MKPFRIHISMMGILILIFNIAMPPFGMAHAAEYSLSLEETYKYAIEASSSVAEAQEAVQKSQIEVRQAKEAVQHQSVKDQSEFAQPHNLAKDLDTRLKVPMARSQYAIAEWTKSQKELELRQSVETAFYQVYQLEKVKEDAYEAFLEKQNDIMEWELRQRLQLANQDEVDAVKEAATKAESAYKQAALNHKAALIQFGDLIGRNLEMDQVSLEVPDQYAELNQTTALRLISHAMMNDASLLSQIEQRKNAELKLKIIRDLYKAKFGYEHMAGIEAVYDSGSVNMELLKVYNDLLLENVQKDWEGNVEIPGLGITLPIPKSFFQGEYDGIRYFDDQRQALIVAQMELNQAMAQEQEIRKTLEQKVKTAYLAAKSAEETYAQSLRAVDVAKQNKATMEVKLQAGLASQADVDLADEKIKEAEAVQDAAYVQYLIALSALNVQSSGGLEPFMREGTLPWQSISDGLAPLNENETNLSPQVSGTWELSALHDGLLGQFSVQVNGLAQVDSYTLHTTDGQRIGALTQIQEAVTHLYVLLNEPQNLEVRLYADGQLVAKAVLEGNSLSGNLQIQLLDEPVNMEPGLDSDASGVLQIGSYRIHLQALTEANLKAARATVPITGQGTYYQSEFADNTWIALDRIIEGQQLMSKEGDAVLSIEDMEAMTVLLSINKDGEVEPMLKAEELQALKEVAEQKQEELMASQELAVKQGDYQAIAQQSVMLTQAQAEISLYEAMLSGDQAAAEEAINLVNNPAAILEAYEETTQVDEGEDDSVESEASLEEAREQANQLAALLNDALGQGSEEEVEQVLGSMLQAQATVMAAESGLTDKMDSAAMIVDILEQKMHEAQAADELEQVAELQTAIAQQEIVTLSLEQEMVFLQMDTLHALQQELAEGDSMTALLDEQMGFLIEKLMQLEKAKYSEEELAALEQEATTGDFASEEFRALPPYHLLSRGFDLTLTSPLVLRGQHAYAPVRSLAEALGATVVWEEETGTVTIMGDQVVIIFVIGSSVALLNGEPVQMDTQAHLVNGKTVTPVRLVAESLGAQVRWDEATQAILISK